LKVAEKREKKTVLEICPLCGSKMEKGFYIVPRQTWWDANEHTWLWFKGTIEKINPFKMTLTNFPGHRCKICKLIVFQYGEADSSAEGSP
jgi:hypothetical protein